MLLRQTLAIVAPTLARSFRRWIFHLGGLGFIPLGLLDSSVIPLPGSMDVLTLGRIVRYSLLAFLAAHYGRRVVTAILQHGYPVLLAVVALIAVAIAALIFILAGKRKKRAHS